MLFRSYYSTLLALVLCPPCLLVRGSDVVDDFMELERQPERFLQGNGKFRDRCNENSSPCESGLECTKIGLLSVCYPMQCMLDAAQAQIEEADLETYAARVMEEAGLNEGNFFNRTTMKLKRGVLSDFGSKYLVNDGVPNALEKAMKNNTIDMSTYKQLSDQCLEPYQDSTFETRCYTGIIVEASAGATFQFKNMNEVDPGGNDERSPVQNVCFGAGPDIGFAFGFVFGSALTETFEDFAKPAVKIDFDAAVGLGAGVGWSWHFPGSILVTEFSIPLVGIGGGFGVSGCFGFGGENPEN